MRRVARAVWAFMTLEEAEHWAVACDDPPDAGECVVCGQWRQLDPWRKCEGCATVIHFLDEVA